MVQRRVNVYGLLTVMVLFDRIRKFSCWSKYFILSVHVFLYGLILYNACCMTPIGCLRVYKNTEIYWNITSCRLAVTDVSDEQSATVLRIFLECLVLKMETL